jgi:hypothetical protein
VILVREWFVSRFGLTSLHRGVGEVLNSSFWLSETDGLWGSLYLEMMFLDGCLMIVKMEG